MTWADENYEHKKLITIANGEVTGDETDFPILISITDSDLTGCLASGYDIKFYNEDEDTQLKHERQEWDNSTGKLIAWVKIPAISSTSDTLLYIYYEYADESSDQADPENVWDANFMGVWHMVDATASTTLDSTSNNNDGAKTSANNPAETAAGKIGKAQDFDGSDYIDFGTSATLKPTTAGTWEIWTYSDNAATNQYFSSRDGVSINNYQFYRGTLPADSVSHIFWGLSDENISGNTAIGTDKYYYIVTTYSDADNRAEFYLDAADDGGGATTGSINSGAAASLYIGDDHYGNGYDGRHDEARVSNIARSANWISTTYNTQDDPSAFMGWGDEESLPVVAVAIRRPGRPFGLKPARIVKIGRIGV